MMDTLLLSRIQFGITITFHIIYPALSIGLASYLTLIEGIWLNNNSIAVYQTCRFWTKILGLTFGMGIISGLVMEFQLGTNWGGFSRLVGPVLGVLFTSETLTAFFVEATFLGLMLFGWGRINRYFHFMCTIMVCLAVWISAFWIMAANSWMQTPSGVRFINGHFVIMSWFQVIFNPSTVMRYFHMILASSISALMIIISVACYYLLKKINITFAKFNLKISIITLSIIMPCQMVIGDKVGLIVHDHQPIKTAAIEGLWNTQQGAPLLLFANIDQQNQKNTFEIGIPHLASLINTHQWNGQLQGLRSVSPTKQPKVANIFYGFRAMIGSGIIIFIFAYYGLIKIIQNSDLSTFYLKCGMILAPSGLIGLIMGWYTAEMGRQPWIVYNIITTASAATPVALNKVIIGFLLILIVYGIIFGYFYNYYLMKIIKAGPGIYNYYPSSKYPLFSTALPNAVPIKGAKNEILH
jgi:cytochrome d ubiquinol oxidase subunit I